MPFPTGGAIESLSVGDLQLLRSLSGAAPGFFPPLATTTPDLSTSQVGVVVSVAPQVDAPAAQPGSAVPINFLNAVPYFTGKGGVLSSFACRVTANGLAGAVVEIGLYNSDPTTLRPTSLIAASGPLVGDAGATPRLLSLAVGQALAPYSLYWFVYLAGVAATTINTMQWIGPGFFGFDGISLIQQWGWRAAFPFAALPNPFPLPPVPIFGVPSANQPPIFLLSFA